MARWSDGTRPSQGADGQLATMVSSELRPSALWQTGAALRGMSEAIVSLIRSAHTADEPAAEKGSARAAKLATVRANTSAAGLVR